MVHYTKNHFKNKAQLKGLINRVGVILAMLLLPICLSAQITFAEKEPVENKPKWWHLKDEMLMPYDSTYLKMQPYPLLEAYKKYIGQTLFSMDVKYANILFLTKNETEIKNEDYLSLCNAVKEEKIKKTKEKDEYRRTYGVNNFIRSYGKEEFIRMYGEKDFMRVYGKKELIRQHGKKEATKILIEKYGEKEANEILKGKIEYKVKAEVIEIPKTYIYNQFTLHFPHSTPRGRNISVVDISFKMPLNKYFEIIDVISATDIEYTKRFDAAIKLPHVTSQSIEVLKAAPIRYEYEYGKVGTLGTLEDSPVFVLRDTETGDTLYSTCGGSSDNPLILVGGFTKIKKELVGQTILKIGSGSTLSKRVQQKWTCVDVSITDGKTRGNSSRGQEITLILQSENDSKKEYLIYETFLKSDTPDYKYITGKQHLKMEQEEEKEIRKRKQEQAEYEKQRKEKINNKKKKLTSQYGAGIAEKILAGKFAVGMSKKACKETMQELTNQIVLIGIPNAYMSRVVKSTATTEVWETYTQGLFGGYADGPFEYLHFNGDKLVKIEVKKNVFR